MQLHPLPLSLHPQPLLPKPKLLPDPLHKSSRIMIQQQLSPPKPERLLEQELLHPQFVADKSLIAYEPPKG